MISLPILVRTALGVLAGLALSSAGPPALLLAAPLGLVLLLARPAALAPARLVVLAAALSATAAERARSPPEGDALSRDLPDDPVRLELEGVVHDADPPAAGASGFVLDVARARDAVGERALRARARVVVPPTEGVPAAEVFPGDAVRLAGSSSRVPGPTNPGAYDARAAAARDLVFTRVDVPDARGVEVRSRGDGLFAGLARLRAAAAAGFDASLPPHDAGLLRSLCLGDRGELDPADRRRFREAGASHILAISGSHVALLVGGLLYLLRRVRAPPRVAHWVALVAVLLFVPFTGSAPPVVRSAAGFALWLSGRLAGLEPSGGVLLATVASGYLVLDPAEAGDPGFRMSFAAALGLVCLAGRLFRAWVAERPVLPGIAARPRAPARAALSVGVAAWIASAPLAAHDLGQVSWVAIPVGVIAVPLSTAVMLAGAVAAALRGVPALGDASRAGVQGLVSLLRGFLDLPAATGLATVSVPPPGDAWLATYALAFAAAAIGGRGTAVAGWIGMTLLLAGLAAAPAAPPPEHVEVTLLDVGHGQAALVRCPDGQTALLDAGSLDRPEPATRIVLPALRALGVTSLSLASASHADSDHAGAIADVLEEVPARAVAVPPRFPAATFSSLCARGEVPLVLAAGETALAGPWGDLRAIGPPRDVARPPSRNDDCLVWRLRTTAGPVMLFPGDREAPGVEALIAKSDVHCDVLLLPHHGHRGRGRDRLVDACGASVLLASAPRSVAPMLPAGTRSTGLLGALRVALEPEGPRVLVFDPTADVPPDRAWRAPGYDPPRGARDPPVPSSTTLLAAAVLLVVVAGLSVRLRWLTAGGAAGAAVLGFAAVAAFSWPGLAALFAPFLAANLLGKLPGGPPSEGPRTLRQVAANGLPAAGGIVWKALGADFTGFVAFAGALSALGADTVATEAGTRWGGRPRHVLSGAPLAPGESGGVTTLGLFASLGGAFLAPMALVGAAGLLGRRGSLEVVLLVAAAGFLGGLFDSVLGACLQRKGTCAVCGATAESREHCGVAVTLAPRRLAALDNDAVNLANGVFAALVAAALAQVLR